MQNILLTNEFNLAEWFFFPRIVVEYLRLMKLNVRTVRGICNM